eukprot:GHVP01012484.1.p1 GENE.GHVP01012484.1~~GHVP01012484.1.p1  ORF type:complete len:660 (+),score=179.72 GHVP01012484.1:34-2013(+)
MKKKKIGNERLDIYYKLAKKHGYRSRAAYKLIHLNEKFGILEPKNIKVVVDLCAAPGGWLQVARESLPDATHIIGIDLDAIPSIPGVITFKQDITTEECRSQLTDVLEGNKAELFLHDGAPNVGAEAGHDFYVQNELTLCSLKLACEFLHKGGSFVTKVFRSVDYDKLVWVFEQLFERVERHKPKSSRDASTETFVVCLNYKCPDSLDEKFFDPENVFKAIDGNSNNNNKNKSKKEGYTEGVTLIINKITVDEFIRSLEVPNILSYTEISFPQNTSVEIKESQGTTMEIIELCKDLQVINKGDIQRLKRWRTKLRKEMELDKVEPENKLLLNEPTEKENIVDAMAKLERQMKKQEDKKLKKIAKSLYGMNADRTDHAPYEERQSTKRVKEEPEIIQKDSKLTKDEKELEEEYTERKNNNKNTIKENSKKKIYSDLFEEAKEIMNAPVDPEITAENNTKAIGEGEAVKKIAYDEISSSDCDSDDERELTDKELAIGKKLMTKEGRKELMDRSVSKHFFADGEDLPNWFTEDLLQEDNYTKKLIHKAKDVIDEKNTKINKKSRKKEIEAIHRNKVRYERKLEQTKSKMESVVNEESTGMEKEGRLKKLDKELRKKNKRDKNYVFVTKGGAKNKMNRNARNVHVDSRMKKDIRREKMKKRRR